RGRRLGSLRAARLRPPRERAAAARDSRRGPYARTRALPRPHALSCRLGVYVPALLHAGGMRRGACDGAGDLLASTTSMALEFDPSILGEEFDRTEHDPVTADELIAFARALGETSPCHLEPGPGLVGHPTYCIRFRGRKFFPDNLPEGLRFRMSFDAGKDIELGPPLRSRHP